MLDYIILKAVHESLFIYSKMVKRINRGLKMLLMKCDIRQITENIKNSSSHVKPWNLFCIETVGYVIFRNLQSYIRLIHLY